jgi:hypothetical protein
MAYELIPQLRREDRLTVIAHGARYHFLPSNPWVAIGWRERQDVEVDLEKVMRRRGVRHLSQGARRLEMSGRTTLFLLRRGQIIAGTARAMNTRRIVAWTRAHLVRAA